MNHDQTIYLDYAAATPMDERVIEAMEPFFSDAFYNPSASYSAGRKVHDSLELARATVAAQLGAKSSEILFTAGGTEANNLAIHGIMQNYPGANCITSALEHDAVLAPASIYMRRLAPVDSQGVVDLDRLAELIDDQTVLVSIMYANNEIGTIEPIRKIAELLQRKRASRSSDLPLYFHTDACQAAGYLDLQVARLGVDLLTLNGGKIYGPKQSGALYVRSGTLLTPQIRGGGQERGLRSGTENVAACVGLATALVLAQTNRHQEVRRLQALQRSCIADLLQQLPGSRLNGSLKSRLPNNIHITIPGTDNERLLVQLDLRGIIAAAGSACSASSDEPSHVLRAIGLSDAEAQASLRFTMGRQTTASQLSRLVATLANML